MRNMLSVVTIVLLTVCAACSSTVGVTGTMDDGDETFTGTTTGYLDKSGVLTVTSNKGRTCTGDWVFASRRTGSGIFRCSDGQGGPFQFVSTGKHGNGVGRIGGKSFSFTFG